MSRTGVVAAGLVAALGEELIADLDEITLEEALASLPDDERDELTDLLDDEAGRESPEAFMSRLVPSEPPPRHTLPLRDFFRRARQAQIREAHSMPPRHAKTVTIMRCLAWWIVTAPRDMCAYVTYSSTQARKKSRIIRELVERAGVVLQRGSRSLEQWQTREGGGLHAVGAKGGLTGNGYSGVVVYDDPYKSLIDAASATERDKIQELFQAAVMTRLEGASVLVMHTRWHSQDLIGWLEAEKAWAVVNIEAIAPANDNLIAAPDPLGRAPGEALWPELFPVARCAGPCHHNGHLEDIREQVGPYIWDALYRGRPPRRGGSVFAVDDGARFTLAEFSIAGHRVGIGCDPAATASTAADYSVIVVGAMLGRGADARLWILDVVRRQVELPDLVRASLPITARWPGAPLFCEAVGGFKSVPQTIRDVDLTVRRRELEAEVAAWTAGGCVGPSPATLAPPRVKVVPVYPTADKLLRAQAVAAAFNAGRVMIPVDAPWASALIAELRAFTGVGDDHDDQVDAIAHLWNGLFRTTAGNAIGRGVMTADDFGGGYVDAEAA